MKLDELRTSRLLLRRLREDDLVRLRRMDADPVIMASMGGVRAAQETEEYFLHQLDHWARHGFGWWVVFDSRGGDFAGRGGLRHVEVGGGLEVEVGYAFVPQFWGRGLATELARASVEAAFASLELADVVSFTLRTNHASRRVMEKAGFIYERDIVYKGFDSVLYRQARQAWLAARR